MLRTVCFVVQTANGKRGKCDHVVLFPFARGLFLIHWPTKYLDVVRRVTWVTIWAGIGRSFVLDEIIQHVINCAGRRAGLVEKWFIYVNENVISKYSFSFLYLFRDNWNLFDLENYGELSTDYITINGVKARKKKENFAVTRSRSRGKIKIGHFTLLFCRGRQMYQNVKRTCRAIVFAN